MIPCADYAHILCSSDFDSCGCWLAVLRHPKRERPSEWKHGGGDHFADLRESHHCSMVLHSLPGWVLIDVYNFCPKTTPHVLYKHVNVLTVLCVYMYISCSFSQVNMVGCRSRDKCSSECCWDWWQVWLTQSELSTEARERLKWKHPLSTPSTEVNIIITILICILTLQNVLNRSEGFRNSSPGFQQHVQ